MLVFSVASIVIFVVKIVAPFFFTLTVGSPEVEAVVKVALISVKVNARGARPVAFAVPTVNAVVSSEQAMPNSIELLLGTWFVI